MSANLASATFQFGDSPKRQPQSAALRDPQTPFNLVVLGDFTGRANGGRVGPFASGKLLRVDCDNFEHVFAQLGARLNLPDPAAPGHRMELTFSSFGDFHPDRLLSRAAALARLFEARRLLLDPATAEQGRTALQAYLGAALAAPSEPSAPTAPVKAESDDQTLTRLLGEHAPAGARPSATRSPVDQFIRQLVTPHVAPSATSWQQGALAAADLELAKRLRALLHHPDFQSLEAVWRGADFLIRRIEAVEEIGVFLVDVSLSELEAEMSEAEPGQASPLFRLLRDHPVSFIAGNFAFGETVADLQALGSMARMAAALNAPFVATASPRLAGCDSFGRHADPDDWTAGLPPEVEAAWEALRKSPQAHCVGLAAPRFLLRQPYGNSGDAIESFPFEELPGEPAHETFLWGHPAMACACLVADAFQAQLATPDAEMEAYTGGELGDLPVHRYAEAGETTVKPCAEAWLSERAVDRVCTCGIIPVVSVKNRNTIRVAGFQSIAVDASPLRGR